MTAGPALEHAIVPHTELVGDCRVRIVGSGGALCEIFVDLADDVSVLKRQVQAETGIPELEQRLSLPAGELHGRDLLGSVVVIGGTAEVGLELRSPEVASWLGRLREDSARKSRRLCLEEAPAELLADAGFMFAAVQEHRQALRFAAPPLKAEASVVRAAVRHSGRSLGFAAEALQDSAELALLAVQQSGWALELVSERLQDDLSVVLAAVQQTGSALEFAGPTARADRAVVLEAVRGDGMCLLQAAPELVCDPELAIAAVQEDWEVIKFLPLEMRADRRVALAAVKSHHPRAAKYEYGEALEHVAPSLRSDRAFCLEAVKAIGRAFPFLPLEFRGDRELALAAVRQDGTAIASMSPDLQDLKIATAAVRQNPQAICYVEAGLRAGVARALGDERLKDFGFRSPQAPQAPREAQKAPDPKLRKHFKTLGLDDTATAQDVRRRYRELALQTHPDKQRGSPERAREAHDRFVAISNAYQAVREEALGG